MYLKHTPAIALAIACLSIPIQARTVTIKASADTEVREQTPDVNYGATASVNVRFNNASGSERNEIGAFRFDLTGYDLTQARNVTFNVVCFRTDSSNRHISLHGINAGTTGATTWDESTVTFNTMPGIVPSDGLWTTRHIDSTTTTLLHSNYQTAATTEGQVLTLDAAAITTFVNNYTGSNIISFLVANAEYSGGYFSSGQMRFASREATSLLGGTTGNAGDFAAYLSFTVPDIISESGHWRAIAAAPFEGSSAPDGILWKHEITGANCLWLMNGFSATGINLHDGSGYWTACDAIDLDSDGDADILWKNTDTGAVAGWLLNNGTPASGISYYGGGDWELAAWKGATDYQVACLIWRNTTTGEHAIWYLDTAGGVAIGASLANPGLLWTINLLADFNGDHALDILWQNPTPNITGGTTLWLMSGTTFLSNATLIRGGGAWTAAAAADFNGDGMADIYWNHPSTGAGAIWLMNGTAPVSSGTVYDSGTAWAPVCWKDFDNDGCDDIIWENSGEASFVIWRMNGLAVPHGNEIVATSAGPWELGIAGDFNNDASTDILWRNRRTEAHSMWLMNAGAYVDWQGIMQGFADNAYDVTTSVNGFGHVVVDTEPEHTGYFAEGSSVSLTPHPAIDYLLSAWTGDAGGTDNPLSVVMDSDKNIGATFVEPDDRAFPGAEGFGRIATGGRGGTIIKVTNLNDSGPGSLRAAIEATGARYVVFEVSGTIQLLSNLNIRNPNITIAGQTAPGDGICLRDYPVFVNTYNVIVRYMRFRMGDVTAQEGDAFSGDSQHKIIIDHCSMSWSTDECASFYDNDNFTMQWCILSESLRVSVHDKGTHGYGGIWGGKRASYHHNLLAHHDNRNPRFCGSRYSNKADEEWVDYRNNVIYNWRSNSVYAGEGGRYNMVNNYYKPGPATFGSVSTRIIQPWDDDGTNSQAAGVWGTFYITGNYVKDSGIVTADNWQGVFPNPDTKDKAELRSETEFYNNGISTNHDAATAFARVLAYAGASRVRDSIDTRIVTETQNGTYTYVGSKGGTLGIIDTQADVGGWPTLNSLPAPTDADNDGMPDSWEAANDLVDGDLDPHGHDLDTYYPNIEVYMNSMVQEITDGEYAP